MKITKEIRNTARRTEHNSGILQIYRENKAFEAQVRSGWRSAFTPEQQLKRLDTRLGKGKGARKERARLWQQMIDLGYRDIIMVQWLSSVPPLRDSYEIAL